MNTFTPWFTHFERCFPLFDHPYNTTRLNERAVEIPLARDFLRRHGRGNGLEVGNVLSHYRAGRANWRVVDRYETGAGIENLDLFAVDGSYDWIVSISTLEHVRRNEPHRNRFGGVAALVYLTGLLAPGGRMFVTVPGGVNAALDAYLMGGAYGIRRAATFVRDGDSWRQTEKPTVKPYRLTTNWAESVWVGEW